MPWHPDQKKAIRREFCLFVLETDRLRDKQTDTHNVLDAVLMKHENRDMYEINSFYFLILIRDGNKRQTMNFVFQLFCSNSFY